MELSSILRCVTLSRMIRARCFPDSLPLAKCHHIKENQKRSAKIKGLYSFVRPFVYYRSVVFRSGRVRALTEGNKLYIYVLGNVGGGRFKTYETPGNELR